MIDEQTLTGARVLIVDDEAANVALLKGMLRSAGYHNVVGTTDSARTLSLCAELAPDIVLLDLHMPPPDGFEVLDQLKPWTLGDAPLPVLVLTADVTGAAKARALSQGALDFLTKPFELTEVLLRIRNLLRTRLLQLRLQEQNVRLENQNEILEERVRARTYELEEARLETLRRLALAAEFRDDETHQHTLRVGTTAGELARRLGFGREQLELIQLAAPLHDVGKVAIPDDLLLKPGRFTEEERERMKEHTTVGRRLLSGTFGSLLQMAEEIAYTHHERWDGAGYPCGIRGEEIPLSGRITAVADVFDALTHDRPYKDAWPVEDAVAEIERLAGTQFDPAVVAAFLELDHEALAAATGRVPTTASGS